MTNKILHIANNHAMRGGVGTIVDRLESALIEQNYQVNVLLSNNLDGPVELSKYHNGYTGDTIMDPEEIANTISNYDIVHFHSMPNYEMLNIIQRAKEINPNFKFIYTAHSNVKNDFRAFYEFAERTNNPEFPILKNQLDRGILDQPNLFPNSFWGKWIDQQEKAMSLADIVQHMNYAYKDNILEDYHAQCNAHKHVVVPHGVEYVNASKVVERPKAKNILYNGRLSGEKGIDQFIEGMIEVFAEHPDALLRVLGGSPDGRDVEEYSNKLYYGMVKRLGEERTNQIWDNDQIWFTGWVSDRDFINESYDWSDFVVIPSKEESFCLTAAEALMKGRIPIITNTSAMRELYIDRGAAIGINNRTPEGIAETINDALYDINSYEQTTMAQRGRELAVTKYTTETMIRRQIEVYRRLM